MPKKKCYSSISSDEVIDSENVNFSPNSRSTLLPDLQETEKEFFELVGSGNVELVDKFLNENKDYNINCAYFQGISALHIAIKIHSESMVAYLLDRPNIQIGDSALHAIRENQINILKLLLDKLGDELEYIGYAGESTDFPDHITPLMLAAQLGNYEIISLLLDRGHGLPRPHKPDCGCDRCQERLNSEDLLHAQTRRLNLYRAISNPAYICHISNDPILTAFELANELELCARRYHEFRSEYIELSLDISKFAVDLISYCRSSQEVELILKKKQDGYTGLFLYPRLVLAIDYKQQNFVAHPNVQHVLEAAWLGNWVSWRRFGPVTRACIILSRGLLLPIIIIPCIFLPNHPHVQHLALPVNKMISHIASYVIFLGLTFAQSNADRFKHSQGPIITGLEPFLVLYVVGFIWGCIRMACLVGFTRYFKILWNLYDLLMLFLFINTFLFWIVAYLDYKEDGRIDVERKYWYYLDPILISEGLFCIATIMAFFRLLFLCQLSYQLGPLQISLGKMSVDIAKFIIIFTVILISFGAGLCKFYQYYDGMVQIDPISGLKIVQQSSFVNLASTLKTLFWAIFCMSPIESADVVIENLQSDVDGSSIINKHLFTEAIGYIVFACFEVICVIVILNMLIATMSNTFQRVTDNVDIEWTFGRMEVYIKYMLETTLPPPLNLIPTTQTLSSIKEWIDIYFKPINEEKAYLSLNKYCQIGKEDYKKILNEYPVLMSQLVQRYFRDKEFSTNSTIDDLSKIKQELKEIKILLKQLVK